MRLEELPLRLSSDERDFEMDEETDYLLQSSGDSIRLLNSRKHRVSKCSKFFKTCLCGWVDLKFFFQVYLYLLYYRCPYYFIIVRQINFSSIDVRLWKYLYVIVPQIILPTVHWLELNIESTRSAHRSVSAAWNIVLVTLRSFSRVIFFKMCWIVRLNYLFPLIWRSSCSIFVHVMIVF